ncbi:hypothetical protein D9M68_506950 [compost metagenome]
MPRTWRLTPGLSPAARQWRETLAALTPSSAARRRVLQLRGVSVPSQLVSKARRATSTFAGGAPRGKSCRMPPRPDNA